MIQKVGIISKPGGKDLARILGELLKWLDDKGIETGIDAVTAEHLGGGEGFDRERMPAGFDLMVVLGGDGTLLSAARAIGKRETPILAVNLGGLGFMMSTGPEELIAQMERVVSGDYRIQSRSVLRAEILRDGGVEWESDALNDIVVNKAAMARLLQLDAFVDEEFVCSYRADGLIISTPTGSTAYSLSAGGPVIFPSVESICVTPICPHTLTNRPVLLPDSSTVEVVIQHGEHTSYLTVDGQVGVDLALHDRIRARRAEHRVHVIEPRQPRFFEVLRGKMKWGER